MILTAKIRDTLREEILARSNFGELPKKLAKFAKFAKISSRQILIYGLFAKINSRQI